MTLLRKWWKADGWKLKLSEEIRHPCIAPKTLVRKHSTAGSEC